MALVHLNIGGVYYTTYNETLINIPYFSSVIRMEGEIKSSVDKPYYIDRDGKIFRHILNLARDHDYNFPMKYAKELEYYGFEYEIHEDKTKEVSLNKTNQTDHYQLGELLKYTHSRIGYQYVFQNPIVTLNRPSYRNTTYYLYVPKVEYFSSSDETLTISEDTSKDYTVLIDENVKVDDFDKIHIEYGIGDKNPTYQWSIRMDWAYVQKSDAVYRSNGYHYIPLPILLGSCNNITIPLHLHIRVKGVNKWGFKLTTSVIETDEKQRLNTCNYELLQTSTHEKKCDGKKWVLPTGGISRIFWKTDDEVDSVKLCNNHGHIEYSMAEFKYSEPKKLGIRELPSNWGCIYFGSFSNVDSYITSSEEHVNVLEFPNYVTGTLFYVRKILIHKKDEGIAIYDDENNPPAAT